MLILVSMKNSISEISVAQLSKTAELQRVLAQLEAILSRKENQKVTEKGRNNR